MPATLTSARPPARLPLESRARKNAGIRRAPYNHALPFLMSGLLICATTLFGQVAGWTLALFMGAAAWRIVAEQKGWELPSMTVRVAIFAPSVAGIVLTQGIQPTAGSLMATLIVLLSLKILELRTARDFTVVALLSYFMVLSGLFYDQSFALCLYLSLAVLLNTVALVRVHLGGRPGTFWPAFRLASGLLMQATPLVILLFIIFPRVQVNFLRRMAHGGDGSTGMSDHLQPGEVEKLVQSNERAFRVKFVSSPPLPLAQLYWRGVVLSKCEEGGMSWRAEPLSAGAGPAQSSPGAAPKGIEQTITQMPQGERWLFALDRPIGVAPNSSVKPQFYDKSQQLRSEQTLRSTVTYTVFSELASPAASAPATRTHKGYIEVPGGLSPQIFALVQSWQAGGASPTAVIEAAEAYFRDGGFSYSLQPGALPSNNALDYFLFHSKSGFCEHFAAAFGTLMRVAKIPSRIVAGYQGGELNELNGFYNVRQSDAHAWCEVWLEGRGWLRVDPTSLVAPGRVTFGAENFAALGADDPSASPFRLGRFGTIGWVRWVRHNTTMAWEALDEQWNLMVVGYDPDKQFAFEEAAGIANVSWFVGVALTVAAVFSILILGAGAMRVVQGLPAWGKRAPDEAAQTGYARFCRRLMKTTGIQRRVSEGPLDFANRASSKRPDLAPEIEHITKMYVDMRYAPGDPTVEKTNLANLLGAIRNFRPRRAPKHAT